MRSQCMSSLQNKGLSTHVDHFTYRFATYLAYHPASTGYAYDPNIRHSIYHCLFTTHA